MLLVILNMKLFFEEKVVSEIKVYNKIKLQS